MSLPITPAGARFGDASSTTSSDTGESPADAYWVGWLMNRPVARSSDIGWVFSTFSSRSLPIIGAGEVAVLVCWGGGVGWVDGGVGGGGVGWGRRPGFWGSTMLSSSRSVVPPARPPPLVSRVPICESAERKNLR